MQTPLEIIESYGSPADSILRAIRYFRHERKPLTKIESEEGIAKLLDSDHVPSYSNEKEAEARFLYLVQETIRVYSNGLIPEMDKVWKEATRRCNVFIERSPWAIKDYGVEETVDGEQPKIRKGAKKQIAHELYQRMNDGTNDRNAIIEALMAEADMTKSGATTYFHNLKKEYGYAGPKTERPKRSKTIAAKKAPAKKQKRSKGPSKGAIAHEVYLDMPGAEKADVIAVIIEKTGTSPAGANTYYCAAKKAVEQTCKEVRERHESE